KVSSKTPRPDHSSFKQRGGDATEKNKNSGQVAARTRAHVGQSFVLRFASEVFVEFRLLCVLCAFVVNNLGYASPRLARRRIPCPPPLSASPPQPARRTCPIRATGPASPGPSVTCSA